MRPAQVLVEDIQQFLFIAAGQAEEWAGRDVATRIAELMRSAVDQRGADAHLAGSSLIVEGAAQMAVQGQYLVLVARLTLGVAGGQGLPGTAIGRGLTVEPLTGDVQHRFADVLKHRGQISQAGLQRLEDRLHLGGVADFKVDIERCAGHQNISLIALYRSAGSTCSHSASIAATHAGSQLGALPWSSLASGSVLAPG